MTLFWLGVAIGFVLTGAVGVALAALGLIRWAARAGEPREEPHGDVSNVDGWSGRP